MKWLERRRTQRMCWHHERATGRSWLESELVDLGRRKVFWCTNCERRWVV